MLKFRMSCSDQANTLPFPGCFEGYSASSTPGEALSFLAVSCIPTISRGFPYYVLVLSWYWDREKKILAYSSSICRVTTLYGKNIANP